MEFCDLVYNVHRNQYAFTYKHTLMFDYMDKNDPEINDALHNYDHNRDVVIHFLLFYICLVFNTYLFSSIFMKVCSSDSIVQFEAFVFIFLTMERW